jgi:hypothetical protein
LGEAPLYDGEPAPEQVPTELLPTLYVLPPLGADLILHAFVLEL